MTAPHVIGIDDGPFDKFRDADTLVAGVVMAGAALVEGVLTTRLAVDGDGAAERLAEWVAGSRFAPALRAVFLDGITIAGLSVVDLPRLADLTGLPVIAVTRKEPGASRLREALEAAGYPGRIPLIDRAGPAHRAGEVRFECAGVEPAAAAELIESQRGKSKGPECLRLAHLIASGVVLGESRGG